MTALTRAGIALSLLALVIAPGAARADTKASHAARPAASPLAGFPRGATFRARGERYALVQGVHAVRRASGETEQQTLARARAGASDVLVRHGDFLVLPGAKRARGLRAHPVAVNARTGGVAVLSGIVDVRLRDPAVAAAVAAAHGLEVVSMAPRIRMAFLRVPEAADVVAAAAALARDPAVDAVEIDALEHADVPR